MAAGHATARLHAFSVAIAMVDTIHTHNAMIRKHASCFLRILAIHVCTKTARSTQTHVVNAHSLLHEICSVMIHLR